MCHLHTSSSFLAPDGLGHRSFPSVIDVQPGRQLPVLTNLILIAMFYASLHARFDTLRHDSQVPANFMQVSRNDGGIDRQHLASRAEMTPTDRKRRCQIPTIVEHNDGTGVDDENVGHLSIGNVRNN